MDNRLLMLVMPFLLIAGVCGMMLIGMGMVAVFLWRVKRFHETNRPPAAERSPDVFFAAKMPGLKFWQPDAFSDLSNRWLGWWEQIAPPFYSQGMIRSLAKPEESWIAFHLERSTYRSAVMRLRTSENEVVLNIRGGGQFDSNAEVDVTFDAESLGYMKLPECLLLNSQGQQIGQYQRRGIALRTMHYAPVTLNGRTIASITDIWVRQIRARRKPEALMQNVAADLSAEDQRWLLALIGIELYYDAMWRRQYD
jgi:hypothetical protein